MGNLVNRLSDKVSLFIILPILFLSCQSLKQEVEVTIINKTETHIDSIVVTNWIEDAKANNISKNDSIGFNLGFENNKVMGDGSYAVSYYFNGKKYFKDFGYYSNGIPTNSNYTIEIHNDTLIVKEQMNK